MPDVEIDRPDLNQIREVLTEKFGASILDATYVHKELSFKIRKEDLLAILGFLKTAQGFNALNDMIGLDHPAPLGEGRKRFSVLYQLYRFPGFQRVRVVVDLDEGESVDSIVPLYRAADWAEREIFDMFGIPFAGHQDLRRIYMPDEFVGHPLRKDFPLEGNESCRLKI
jgi:NADH-quinone oxidoreductase subunit C